MTVTLNTEEPFNGKIFAVSSPRLILNIIIFIKNFIQFKINN